MRRRAYERDLRDRAQAQAALEAAAAPSQLAGSALAMNPGSGPPAAAGLAPAAGPVTAAGAPQPPAESGLVHEEQPGFGRMQAPKRKGYARRLAKFEVAQAANPGPAQAAQPGAAVSQGNHARNPKIPNPEE